MTDIRDCSVFSVLICSAWPRWTGLLRNTLVLLLCVWMPSRTPTSVPAKTQQNRLCLLVYIHCNIIQSLRRESLWFCELGSPLINRILPTVRSQPGCAVSCYRIFGDNCHQSHKETTKCDPQCPISQIALPVEGGTHSTCLWFLGRPY